MFPHLQPFADATKLSPAERADSMYRTPLYLLFQETSAKYAQRLRYNSTGAGDRCTLNLGALQIREGSEQLEVRRPAAGAGHRLQHRLRSRPGHLPQPGRAVRRRRRSRSRRATRSQDLFAVAPTTVMGLATTYSLGRAGAVNLIGLYQREKSAFNRPPLGFEASANLVGGANTELHFKPNGLTQLLNSLTPHASTAPSTSTSTGVRLHPARPQPDRARRTSRSSRARQGCRCP